MNPTYIAAGAVLAIVIAVGVGHALTANAHQPAEVEVSATDTNLEPADCYLTVYVDTLNDDDRVILEQPFAETVKEQLFRTSPILREAQYGDFEEGQGKSLGASVNHGDRIRVYSIAFDEDRVTMQFDGAVTDDCTVKPVGDD